MSQTIVTIDVGGTGANTAAAARNNLGAVANTGGTITGNLTLSGATLNTATANISTIVTGNTLTLSTATGSNANIVFSANGTEYLRISNTGSVGIGTTNPSGKLHAAITADGGDAIYASSNNTNGVMILRPDGANGSVVRYGGDGANANILRFVGVGEAEYMRINVGNVGVGTTNPGAKLHVLNSANTGSYQDFNSRIWNLSVPVPENTHYQRFKINVGSTRQSALVKITYVPYSNGGIASMNGGTSVFNIWRADGGPSVLPVSIQQSGGGAGCVILSYPVVSGNDIIFGLVSGNNGTGTNYIVNIKIEIISNNLSEFSVSTISGTTAATGTNPSDSTVIFTNGSERLRIDASGNVGIGTTNVIHKLMVAGNTSSTAFYLRGQTYGTLSETTSGAMTILGHNARASDDFTNRVTTQNSSWFSHFIRMYYDHGIAFHTSSVLRNAGDIVYDFTTPGNVVANVAERMRISKDGHITAPFQPIFNAYGCGSGSFASGSTWIFPTTSVNIGSHYNASNGRFTAPVAGTYFFYWSNIGNTVDTVYRYYIYKNGSAINNSVHLRLDCSATGTDYADSGSQTLTVTLAVNDFITIFFASDNSTASYPGLNDDTNPYPTFGGYLIG